MSRRIPSVLVAAALCLTAAAGFDRFDAEAAGAASGPVDGAAGGSTANRTVEPETTAAPLPASAAAEPAPTVEDNVVTPAAPPVRLIRINTRAASEAGVSPSVLVLALGAVRCAIGSGAIERPPTLTVIDYSKPSVEPRLWVFDTTTGELLFHDLVAHGRNSGDNMATRFSDAANSLQSSLGLFVTGDTYVGSNGYSLRLDGLEPGFNAHARERAIVMHGAPYVDQDMALAQGRLGRSWGCPALREAIARDVIDTIRGGGAIFSYYPDADWLAASQFLNGCNGTAAPLRAAG